LKTNPGNGQLSGRTLQRFKLKYYITYYYNNTSTNGDW